MATVPIATVLGCPCPWQPLRPWQPQPSTGLLPAHRDATTAVPMATVPMATARGVRAHGNRTHAVPMATVPMATAHSQHLQDIDNELCGG